MTKVKIYLFTGSVPIYTPKCFPWTYKPFKIKHTTTLGISDTKYLYYNYNNIKSMYIVIHFSIRKTICRLYICIT